MENTNKSQRYCLACGKEIIQLPKTKPKKFCCDKCRITYWHIKRKNDTEHHLEDSYICKHCGKKFFAYCAKDRKYCSHECYISDRYGTANERKGTENTTLIQKIIVFTKSDLTLMKLNPKTE